MINLRSRYDYYLPSVSIDEETRDQYPDVLSVDFSKGKLSQVPTSHLVTSADMDKFCLYFARKYGAVGMDDILLPVNGIPYQGMLEPGSTLFEVVYVDLDGWLSNQPDEGC
jgi:hypothetical protein